MSRLTQGSLQSFRIRGCHPLRPAFPDHSANPAMTTGLFRFRSPLLAESLLMSFPPATEMFQFAGFAFITLCIQMMIPQRGWVAPFGHPRIKACSRLPVDFRSVPRPSSPPGAKASTECPSHAHPHAQETTRTRMHPIPLLARPSDARLLRSGAHDPRGRSAPVLASARQLTRSSAVLEYIQRRLGQSLGFAFVRLTSSMHLILSHNRRPQLSIHTHIPEHCRVVASPPALAGARSDTHATSRRTNPGRRTGWTHMMRHQSTRAVLRTQGCTRT